MASETSVVVVVLAFPPQQPQPPQQHLQLSGKRYHFLESIPPCCGGCVTAEKSMKPEMVCAESTGKRKPLRVPYLTPSGTMVTPFDSDPKYHWWKSKSSQKVYHSGRSG